MSSKRAEQDGVDRENAYSDELLCANWNPVLALLEWSCARTLTDVRSAPSSNPAEEDPEAFLGRIYTSGA